MTHPFVPVPNTALIETVYSYEGQIIENAFHVVRGTPWTAADMFTLLTLLDTHEHIAGTSFQGNRTGGCQLTLWRARALDTSSSPVAIYTLPTPRGGAIGGGVQLPPAVTKCLTLQTGLAGRSYRGRWYWCGLNSAQVQGHPNGGKVDPTSLTQMVQCINDLITYIHSLDATQHMVVTSLYNNGAWRTTGVNTIITNAAFSSLNLDNQRRRSAGRGH